MKAKYPNDELHYGLGYSWSTYFTTKLFTGAIYASYQMTIYVQVYDNDGAYTVYELDEPIFVVPNSSGLTVSEEKLILSDPNFEVNQLLNEGEFLPSIQELQAISSLMNLESLSDTYGMILLNKSSIFFPQKFGPLSNYSGVSAVRNLMT